MSRLNDCNFFRSNPEDVEDRLVRLSRTGTACASRTGHIYRRHSRVSQEERLLVSAFIEGWYDPDRLHSGIGYQSSNRYEKEYLSRDYSQSEESPSPVAV
jgi:hypothetical protein